MESLCEQAGIADFALEEEILFIRRKTPTDGQDVLEPVRFVPVYVQELGGGDVPGESERGGCIRGPFCSGLRQRVGQMCWFLIMDAPSRPKAARLVASLLNGSQYFRSSLCLTLVVRWTETGL